MGSCWACRGGEAGPGAFRDEVACLADMETMMTCGCGGYVSHEILRCAACGRYYLTAFEDHWAPSSADSFVYEIYRAEAEAILARWRTCPEIRDRRCDCAAHRESESLHWADQTAGVRRYYRAIDQR